MSEWDREYQRAVECVDALRFDSDGALGAADEAKPILNWMLVEARKARPPATLQNEVTVVRCRDCVWSQKREGFEPPTPTPSPGMVFCWNISKHLTPDWYCADGDRLDALEAR